MYKLELNYPAIPILSVGFTRGEGFVGNAIRLIRGGRKAVHDTSFPNHAFLTGMLNNEKNKICIEETFDGLKPQSLDQYLYSDNRIVSMYYWKGWDDPVRRNEALDYLAYLCRKQGDKKTKEGKYNPWGLFSFVPIIGKWKCFQPDPVEEWCSENCASVHKKFGAPFIDKVEVAPDELEPIMKSSPECIRLFNYYKYPEGV
jgi:hypothetical protein